jgi:hypothetical protein
LERPIERRSSTDFLVELLRRTVLRHHLSPMEQPPRERQNELHTPGEPCTEPEDQKVPTNHRRER